MAVVLMGGWNANARAQENGINGFLFGAGGGAFIGQVIGRNTEATLIGTAVGGMLGYIVGNERDKQGVTRVHTVYQQPVRYLNNRPSQKKRVYKYVKTRPSYVPAPVCREMEMLATINGRPERIFGTACLENGNWVMNRPDVNITQTVIIKKDHQWRNNRHYQTKHWQSRRHDHPQRRYSRADW